MSRYAVLDLETTGFSPAHNHRVVEIAVVLVDDDGRLVYEWETLVNPEREVSASEVHELTGAELCRAPLFAEIAGELAALLRGRVPVSHNFAFDGPFLSSEFARIGVSVPLTTTSGLCTMRLADHYLPGVARGLEVCCKCIGCEIEQTHAALPDARAAARLLGYYMAQDPGFRVSWSESIRTAQTAVWPALPAGITCCVSRRQLAEAPTEHFLARLASRAPRVESHPEANSYLALLDLVLLDRRISHHEEDELIAAANMVGLSREEALQLHSVYLNSLGRVALEDGVVTEEERSDLELVAAALGLSPEAVEAALTPCGPEQVACTVGSFVLRPGDAVVFTGEAPGIDRADLESQAKSLGLRVTSAVSGRTRLVVAADPDSLSGKARKARASGVPIVDYPTYASMLCRLVL